MQAKQAERFTPDMTNLYKQIVNNNSNSGYSNHILSTRHAYECITDTTNIIKTEEKGKHINILEKYHIYKISKNRVHMNDKHIDIYNPIFETLQILNTR
jgi:hypothetical protein